MATIRTIGAQLTRRLRAQDNGRLFRTRASHVSLNSGDEKKPQQTPVVYHCPLSTHEIEQLTVFNLIDFSEFAGSWDTGPDDIDYNHSYDFDNSDLIDYSDLSVLSQYWLSEL